MGRASARPTNFPCSTVQYSAVQCSTVQYNAVQCSTVQYSAVQCSTVQYTTVTVQYSTAVLYGTARYDQYALRFHSEARSQNYHASATKLGVMAWPSNPTLPLDHPILLHFHHNCSTMTCILSIPVSRSRFTNCPCISSSSCDAFHRHIATKLLTIIGPACLIHLHGLPLLQVQLTRLTCTNNPQTSAKTCTRQGKQFYQNEACLLTFGTSLGLCSERIKQV